MRKRQILGAWRRLLLGLLVGALVATSMAWAAPNPEEPALAPGRVMAQQAIKEKALWITTDHAQHEILKQPLASGPEVTKACLSCHNQAALQFHKTIHWTWMDPSTADSVKLGKGGLSINNF